MRRLIVWDIDETLWHADYDMPGDFYLFGGTIGVRKRPHADEILRRCFAHGHLFETGFWTAGTADYAAEFVKRMLLPSEAPALVFARDRCTPVWRDEFGAPSAGEVVKDLKKVRRRGFDLDGVLMVDNTSSVLRRNYGNHVPIPSFFGDPKDDYLERLWPRLLEWICDPGGVRRIDKRGWHLGNGPRLC